MHNRPLKNEQQRNHQHVCRTRREISILDQLGKMASGGGTVSKYSLSIALKITWSRVFLYDKSLELWGDYEGTCLAT